MGGNDKRKIPEGSGMPPTVADSSQISLTASIFGSSAKNDNAKNDSTGDIFSARKTKRFARVVEDRIKQNESKVPATATKYNNTPERTGKDRLSSVDEIMARRKFQAEHPFLKTIRIPAAYPVDSHGDHSDSVKIPPEVRVKEIADVIRQYGFAVVPNVVSKQLLNRLSEKAEEIQSTLCRALDRRGIQWRCDHNPTPFRFYEVAARCGGRMDTRYKTAHPPFNHLDILQNPTVLPVVNSLLGGDLATDDTHLPRLVYAGLILSFPGSEDQPFHQDGAPLFPELATATNESPSYALNIFLPLTEADTTLSAGPTEFIPGSHMMPEGKVMRIVNGRGGEGSVGVVGPKLRQGDALLYDYRICHRGTSNLTAKDSNTSDNNCGGKVRRILYLMYARPWFKEHLNFGEEMLIKGTT